MVVNLVVADEEPLSDKVLTVWAHQKERHNSNSVATSESKEQNSNSEGKTGGKIQTPPGVPEGGYGPVGAGAGAGGHLGGGPSIRSSSGGQDEAIDTPTIVLGALVRPVHCYLTAF